MYNNEYLLKLVLLCNLYDLVNRISILFHFVVLKYENMFFLHTYSALEALKKREETEKLVCISFFLIYIALCGFCLHIFKLTAQHRHTN